LLESDDPSLGLTVMKLRATLGDENGDFINTTWTFGEFLWMLPTEIDFLTPKLYLNGISSYIIYTIIYYTIAVIYYWI
jgi:hypothetical protein